MLSWIQAMSVHHTNTNGQAKFTTPGTYQWTVPEGIYKVCCVVIGAGGQGTNGFGGQTIGAGAGGALRYKNDITVSPGQVFTIVVGSGGVTGSTGYNNSVTDTANHTSSVVGFGLTAGVGTTGTAFGNGVLGGNGGYSNGASGLGQTSSGGPCGTYVNGTTRATYKIGYCGDGTGLYGSTTGGGYPNLAGTCGGGGNATGPAEAVAWSNKSYRKGGDGGVRIIWGENRAFPLLNVQDL
ncbi:hypothetical protein D3C75_664090 [compost metagenome]